jgi:hypothetical protein
MIGGVTKSVGAIALAAVAFAIFFAPAGKHRPLNPDEPIAADGSIIAGRARTIFDTEPAYREPARPNPDDPIDFEQRLKDEKTWTDHSREPIAQLVGPLDRSTCENARHKRLIASARVYYDARGRQKRSFAMRGPRAKAAIEKEWSTPLDRRIDEFVRASLLSGFLRKDDFPAPMYPEFPKLFAHTDEAPDACPPKSESGTEGRRPDRRQRMLHQAAIMVRLVLFVAGKSHDHRNRTNRRQARDGNGIRSRREKGRADFQARQRLSRHGAGALHRKAEPVPAVRQMGNGRGS